MVGNVGKGTKPELALRRLLSAAGARGYRLNARAEGIRPDLVWAGRKVAVFVHGCFWHRCPTCRYP
ncbi:MAG: very short patch repair endonuclease, partial [Chloroflexota bacterium]|nr:very short patch repair endonuclease [Chloroflexota bacterium]